MRVRVLTEWKGSPPCGSVAEVPDPVAWAQIATGNAEAVAVVAPPRQMALETATLPEVEQAVSVKRGRRR